MSNVKEKMTEITRLQPEDATYEEIMRELMFERMVARGLDDVNRRAKLTRILGKSALKSFHPGLLNVRHLVGEIWSDDNEYNCRNKKASFC